LIERIGDLLLVPGDVFQRELILASQVAGVIVGLGLLSKVLLIAVE